MTKKKALMIRRVIQRGGVRHLKIHERQMHPFHIVNRSPWPFFTSLAVFGVAMGAVLYMHRMGGGRLLFYSFLFLVTVISYWLRDVVCEATYEGHHTKRVRAGLRLGFKLFIASEVMLFFSFFWAFFHAALVPSIFIGRVWPPKGVIPYYIEIGEKPSFEDWVKVYREALRIDFNEGGLLLLRNIVEEKIAGSGIEWLRAEMPPLSGNDDAYWVQVPACKLIDDALNRPYNGYRWAFCAWPLYNPYTIPLGATIILVTSGATLHNAGRWFKNNDRRLAFVEITKWLVLTIILGLFFTCLQLCEYIVFLPFAINDSVFGSCFYMLTGLHGVHVILGTIGLLICLYRHRAGHFTQNVHVGFECAVWYWHFVDIVWLFVYAIVYWWSAPPVHPYLWYNERTADGRIKMWSCGEKPWTYEEVVGPERAFGPDGFCLKYPKSEEAMAWMYSKDKTLWPTSEEQKGFHWNYGELWHVLEKTKDE